MCSAIPNYVGLVEGLHVDALEEMLKDMPLELGVAVAGDHPLRWAMHGSILA